MTDFYKQIDELRKAVAPFKTHEWFYRKMMVDGAIRNDMSIDEFARFFEENARGSFMMLDSLGLRIPQR